MCWHKIVIICNNSREHMEVPSASAILCPSSHTFIRCNNSVFLISIFSTVWKLYLEMLLLMICTCNLHLWTSSYFWSTALHSSVLIPEVIYAIFETCIYLKLFIWKAIEKSKTNNVLFCKYLHKLTSYSEKETKVIFWYIQRVKWNGM